ncbi:branched-chain amino acid transaminase [Streptomyces aureoverticillatus]|uniref:branched-chain amino acid transaminase n=1 Tax=Streptomyces aureoverticillatus TaxID=66871 RepID=UPI0013D927C3|nr:branched-chain amino acid transaminase [Streptomyces aureoverticillatus]QIB47731.1 branched-chain amino acid transaminase [Streptomyces aureoverticillatus]
MTVLTPAEYIWMDGRLVAWQDAQVHVLTQSLHYGWAVYEGIRAHETADGTLAVFRLRDHLARLTRSARVYRMDIPYTEDELAAATTELIAAGGHGPRYVRPLVYLGYGSMGVALDLSAVRVSLASWEWEEQAARNWRLMTSSWRRTHQDTIPPLAKATGAYLNSSLAKLAAVRAGYDDALLLTAAGHLSESSAANVFLVRSGVLHTPPVHEGILPGITRATVLELARAAGIPVQERPLSHAEAYTCDELFLTGTAIGIVPVESLDDRPTALPAPGPVTTALRGAYRDAVAGKNTPSADWLTSVRVPRAEG